MKKVLLLLAYIHLFLQCDAKKNNLNKVTSEDKPIPYTSSNGTLLDSMYYWKWNQNILGWNLFYKNIYSYDTNNNNTFIGTHKWNGSAWLDSSQYFYAYDGNNNFTDILFQVYDTVASAWINITLYHAAYDLNNNETDYFYQSWDSVSSSWINNSLYHATFDTSNNKTSEATNYSWNGVVWTNGSKTVFAYDTNNNLTSRISQNWDSTAQSWVNSYHQSYTYNINNDSTTYLIQRWDTSSTSWLNSWQAFYSYDSINNNTFILQQIWDTTSWADHNQQFFTYDASHHKINELDQVWRDTVWVDNEHRAFAYDANNNQTHSFDEVWVGYWIGMGETFRTFDANSNFIYGNYYTEFHDALYNVGDYHATYDANNNLLYDFNDTWGVPNGSYGQAKHFYTYDADSNRISAVTQEWEFTNSYGYSSDTDSVHYYYSNFSSISESNREDFSVFPNPTTNTFTIKNISSKGKTLLLIINLFGEIVYTENLFGKKEYLIDANFAKGIYFVRVSDGERNTVKKLVVE